MLEFFSKCPKKSLGLGIQKGDKVVSRIQKMKKFTWDKSCLKVKCLSDTGRLLKLNSSGHLPVVSSRQDKLFLLCLAS